MSEDKTNKPQLGDISDQMMPAWERFMNTLPGTAVSEVLAVYGTPNQTYFVSGTIEPGNNHSKMTLLFAKGKLLVRSDHRITLNFYNDNLQETIYEGNQFNDRSLDDETTLTLTVSDEPRHLADYVVSCLEPGYARALMKYIHQETEEPVLVGLEKVVNTA